MASYEVIALHSLWLAECTYVASWLAQCSGTRHIASIQGQDALVTNPYLKHLSFKRMTLTAVSANAATEFCRSTGRRVDYIVPTGLDPGGFPNKNETVTRSIDILGVGSLTRLKDFKLFIEIVRRVRATQPVMRCMILGEGAERSELERQIKKDGLDGIVQLSGHLTRENVLGTMREAKILLHTSGYEGQGYVFLEALASGMRVVSFDVGYAGTSPEVYRCKSAEEMVSTLKTLLVSAPEALAENTEIETIDDTSRAFERIYGLA
jgi:glycosyltransferase involved in cell wall biosynthesis